MVSRPTLVSLILLLFPWTAPRAEHAAELLTWSESLPIDSRIPEGIQHFGRDLAEAYPFELGAALRRLIVTKTADFLRRLEREECVEFVEVTFPEAGFAATGMKPGGKGEREFEEGFVCIEAFACYRTEMGAHDALEAYTAPEFRKSVSSRIERIFEEEGLSCVETHGVKAIMRGMLTCNRIDELHEAGLSAQHSQVVSSSGKEDGRQRVYFKESLKTFVEIPGGLALHYVNYTRAKKLGGLKRLFGKGKIASSQERAIEELRRLLQPEIAASE